MKQTRKLLASFAIVVTTLAVATAGWAYWSAAGFGSGSATMGTLNAPTITAASASGSTVTVTWSPVPSPGGEPVRYHVLRDGQAAGGNCPTSSAPNAVTQCTDPNIANGSHDYQVVAIYRSWTAESNEVAVLVSSDTTAPTLTALEMFDTNANGKVDQLKATFSEPLASYTAGIAPWTLTNVPSGGSLASVAINGAAATLTLTEGNGGADTAVGPFTVALTANPAGIRDSANNQSSFPASAPIDKAVPTITAITSQQSDGGNGNGKLEENDKLILTFSENLQTIPTSFEGATLSRASNSVNATLNISGITDGDVDTGSMGYLAQPGNRIATFSGSIAVMNNGAATTVTVTVLTLTGANTGTSTGALAFEPSSSLKDLAGNSATTPPPTPSTFKLF